VGAIVMLVLILRGQRSGGGSVPGPVGYRVVDDGFWLPAARFSPGTSVRYRCRVGPHLRTGSFTVQHGPRGQFVYTGDRPEDIEILEVLPTEVPPDTDTWDEPSPSGPSGGSGDFGDKSEPSSGSGGAGDFPSAY